MLPLRYLVGVFLGAVLVFALLLAPPSLLLAAAGHTDDIGYRTLSGRWWQPRVEGLVVRGVPLGDAEIEVSPLALFGGTFAGHVAVKGGKIEGQADIRLEGSLVRLSDFRAVVPLAGHMGQTRLSGALSLTGGELALGPNGRCSGGQADVRSDIAAALFKSYGIAAPLLIGTAACQDDRMVLDMKGGDDTLAIAVTGTVAPSGLADCRVVLSGPLLQVAPDQVRAALAYAGFEQKTNGWVGRLQVNTGL